MRAIFLYYFKNHRLVFQFGKMKGVLEMDGGDGSTRNVQAPYTQNRLKCQFRYVFLPQFKNKRGGELPWWSSG